MGVVVGCSFSAVFPRKRGSLSAREFERLCAPAPGVEFRKWEYIVLHHSAGPAGDAASIDSSHRHDRGWQYGLGYDFVIGNGSRSGDGEIEVSERWRKQMAGAHCKADHMNEKGVGICFVGNFEEGQGPTDEQIRSGTALVQWLAARFSIPPERVLGHGSVDGAETRCPGRFFPIAKFQAAAHAW